MFSMAKKYLSTGRTHLLLLSIISLFNIFEFHLTTAKMAEDVSSKTAIQRRNNEQTEQTTYEKCLKEHNVLLNEAGETKWFDSTKLKKAAKIQSKPKPIYAKGITVAIVEFVVDEEGVVKCARAVSGHPIVRVAAVKSTEKWRFTPFVFNNRVTAIAGRIQYRFENSKVSY